MEAPVNLMQSSTSSSEVVYGGSNFTAGSDEPRVMSEKVQMLASAIYKELEVMIKKHGQDSVKDLMPLVVNVLENLDMSYIEKEEHLVDLEMLKEENEQLLNQFERERQMRRSLDQKFLELEEGFLEQNREMEGKVESLESIVRMLELRAKNSSDHAARLEEREADQKLEYEKLHERYNELLRTHIEHVERTKFLMGAEMFDMAQSLPLNMKNRNNMAMSVIDTNVRGISDLISAVSGMSQSTHANVNLANHISSERDWQDEFGQQTAAEILQSPRDEQTSAEPLTDRSDIEENDEKSAEQHRETTSDRLTAQHDDGDATSLGADLTGQLVDPAEFASAVNDTFIGMGREVENLIKENTELLETKNALNIVKNDLIARVDELSSEHEILREEVRSLEMVKLKMSERIRELEADLKELKEKKSTEEIADEQEDVPMAQRKRFTRVEMARVLMERNQYKEKLIELQEAMKFTEMQRAKRMTFQQSSTSSRTGIWDFFSSLFSGDSAGVGGVERGAHHHHHRHSSQARKSSKKSVDTSHSRKVIARNFDIDMDSVQEKRMAERRQQYKAVSQHMKKEDDSRTQAYGWSIPANVDTTSTNTAIPVPVCCRPLLDQQPSLKIWCAASVAMHGGRTKDGEFIVGDPLLGCDPTLISESDLKRMNDAWLCESSSLIWVCSSNERRSFVTILDANSTNCILECFVVCASHLLCVASVAGVHESEIREDEDFRSKLVCDGGYLKDVPADIGGDLDSFGSVQYVELRRSECDDQVPTYCAIDEKQSPKRSRDFSINSSPAPDESVSTTQTSEVVEESSRQGGITRPKRRGSIATLLKPSGLESLEKVSAISEMVKPSEMQTQTGLSFADSQNTLKCVWFLENEKSTILQSPERHTNKKDEDSQQKNPSDSTAAASMPLHIRETLNKYEKLNENTTALPTIWLGSENDYVFIHSGVVEWRRCLRRIKMPDSVLHILHLNGRVFAALANGSIVVFHRDAEGNWSDSGYNIIQLGNARSSVCHLINVEGRLWAAYRNCVVVINAETLKVERVFVAHPRKDSQVRQMVHVDKGVWLTIRLDSTIRLYHSQTHQHLQDVDIEPYITKMLGTNKLDFLHLRITSLVVLNKRLWIGTGTGVILSVPLSEENNSRIDVLSKSGTDSAGSITAGSASAKAQGGPGGLIRVYGANASNSTGANGGTGLGALLDSRSASYGENCDGVIPYCNMTQAQLSFHGHKDAVRFFLPVLSDGLSNLTQTLETRKLLIISGGDGYIDFRLGEDEQSTSLHKEQIRVRDMSHLIIWEIECPMTNFNTNQPTPTEDNTSNKSSS